MSGEELRASTALARVIHAMCEYRDNNQSDLVARVVAGELLTIVEAIVNEAQDPDPRDRADDRGAEPVDREQRGVGRGDPAADLRRGPLDEVASREDLRAALETMYNESQDSTAWMDAYELLRDALVATPEPSGPIDYNPYPNPFDENGDFIEAAPSTEPALDVDRLAKAIKVRAGQGSKSALIRPRTDYRELAADIAAEYDRLAESQP